MRQQRPQPLSGHRGGKAAPARISGRQRDLAVPVGLMVIRGAEPLGTAAGRRDPDRRCVPAHEASPVPTPDVEPTDQGRVASERLLNVLEPRGLAREGLKLTIQCTLELHPLTAEFALLVAQAVDLLFLLLGEPGLGSQAGDAFIEPLELAGQLGLAAAL